MFSNFESTLLKNKTWILFLLILIGGLIRIAYISDVPGGLNQDEASAGYETFALLTAGVDRCGNSFPMYFVAWGSGQNVLYSYLSMPFIATMGLNIFSLRLLSAIIGILTLWVFYLLARKIRGESFALIALFILVINPWHIMISRWALESNLLPFMLLLGIYFFICSFKKEIYLIFSAIIFGLSFYAYATNIFFLPLFFIFTAILIFKWKIKYSIKMLCFSFSILFILALPILLFSIVNSLKLDSINFLGMTIPRLTDEPRLYTNIFVGGKVIHIFRNIAEFLSILLSLGFSSLFNNELLSNSIPGFGSFYIFGWILMVYGIFSIDKKNKKELIMLVAVVCAVICSPIIYPNINRMNMAYLPLIYFNALGLYKLIQKSKQWRYVGLGVYTVSFSLFLIVYFTYFKKNVASQFNQGFGEAICFANTLNKKHWYITNKVNMSYIFILFYNQPPPDVFYNTVEYENPDGYFRRVNSFDKYSFGDYSFENYIENNDGVYIMKTDEINNRTTDNKYTEFGPFTVISSKK